VKTINRLLIANRGEIAVRIARSARRLGIATIAVCSDADLGSPHVAACDEHVPIGGLLPSESYLVIDKIIAAARATGAQAIHPGYGFLSENAAFAAAVAAAGMIFIGPPASAIEAMGDKARARRRMSAAGIPVVPGYDGDDQDEALLLEQAERIGFPIMVKAAAGGGGRGMRRVEQADDLAAALRSAASEAVKAFGDGRLILERGSSSRGTSRSRCSPTRTATSCISASATARCSAATRRSSRRHPRLPSIRCCASAWAAQRRRWRARSAMWVRERSSSCSTPTASSISWR
jgi:acetyl/propionyl-CoA carboxylase alpha subunit